MSATTDTPLSISLNTMTHEQKIVFAIETLKSRGVSKSMIAPPLFTLVWKLGLRVPPPIFLRFSALVCAMGIPFGLSFGLLMWLFVLGPQRMSASQAAIVSLLAGVMFGVAIAAPFRLWARKLNLPSWSDYVEQG